MPKQSKRYKVQKAKFDGLKQYNAEQACDLVCKTASTKFDESIDIAIKLGVDPKKADQNVRGTVALPHGVGKTVRVAVFAKGQKADEATAAGADFVGSDDLVEKIKGGFLDFDSVIATPDMMVQVGKIGKILGPKGLMPSPKVGTVTFDISATVKSVKGGRVEFKVEKAGIIQASIGKASFGPAKIKDNLNSFFEAINKVKPSTSKGVYLQTATISCSMGPGVTLDVGQFRA